VNPVERDEPHLSRPLFQDFREGRPLIPRPAGRFPRTKCGVTTSYKAEKGTGTEAGASRAGTDRRAGCARYCPGGGRDGLWTPAFAGETTGRDARPAKAVQDIVELCFSFPGSCLGMPILRALPGIRPEAQVDFHGQW
jgi:hypothetical protein